MHARREHLGEDRFVDVRDLQEVGHQVAAVDDLARHRLFDLAHRGYPPLYDERAQRHGLALQGPRVSGSEARTPKNARFRAQRAHRKLSTNAATKAGTVDSAATTST